jgi:hypothetical protein
MKSPIKLSLVSSGASKGEQGKDNRDAGSPIPCTLVRDVTGSIASWDGIAEQRYGFPKSQAVGSVSHQLLRTVFPYPLSEINDELLRRNIWKGELIHTIRDGSRVKVLSRWELYKDETDGVLRVREVNAGFMPVSPEEAQLTVPSFNASYLVQFMRAARKHLLWVFLPAVFLTALFLGIWLWTHSRALAPLHW